MLVSLYSILIFICLLIVIIKFSIYNIFINFAAPSGPPISIMPVNETISSMTIQWAPPDPLDANGVILMYSMNFTRVAIRDTVVRQFSKDTLSYRQQGIP